MTAADSHVDAQPIRVLIADDHPLFRSGMAHAISESPDMTLVAECTDGREAIRHVLEMEPDVAVLDLRMPLLDGIKIVELARGRGSVSQFVILSAFRDPASVFDAIAVGASAYLPKDADRAEVCAAIRIVAAGGTVLPDTVRSELVSEIRLRNETSPARLGGREREVVVLTAAGMSAPEIAQQLHIAPSTVKTHLARVYEKLGVSDRAAMVAEAMRRRLLD
jgi:two-component system nitrate/nitrite response regulator NarL